MIYNVKYLMIAMHHTCNINIDVNYKIELKNLIEIKHDCDIQGT